LLAGIARRRCGGFQARLDSFAFFGVFLSHILQRPLSVSSSVQQFGRVALLKANGMNMHFDGMQVPFDAHHFLDSHGLTRFACHRDQRFIVAFQLDGSGFNADARRIFVAAAVRVARYLLLFDVDRFMVVRFVDDFKLSATRLSDGNRFVELHVIQRME